MIADLVLDAKAILGEGAIWHTRERVLFGMDILGKRFWRFDPATGKQEAFGSSGISSAHWCRAGKAA